MAENPNLNMALEAVLRDRDDLYRRLMQAERKLKEMSDLQAMKDSYEARLSEKDKIIEAKDKAIESKDNRIASLKSLKLRIRPLNPRTTVSHRWNANWSILRGKYGGRCLKRENSLTIQIN